MIRWFARIVQPFQQAADQASAKVVNAIVNGETRLVRMEATVQRLERQTAAAVARLERFETATPHLETLLDQMHSAARSVGVLLADLEGTSKGIEARVSRAIQLVIVDLTKIAAGRDAENQRLNDEAERWRKLAIAKYEADMEQLPARVSVKKTPRS